MNLFLKFNEGEDYEHIRNLFDAEVGDLQWMSGLVIHQLFFLGNKGCDSNFESEVGVFCAIFYCYK